MGCDGAGAAKLQQPGFSTPRISPDSRSPGSQNAGGQDKDQQDETPVRQGIFFVVRRASTYQHDSERPSDIGTENPRYKDAIRQIQDNQRRIACVLVVGFAVRAS